MNIQLLLRFISPFLLLTPAWASANVEHLRKVPSAQSTISSVELMITKKIMENLSPPKPGRSLSTGLSFLDFSEFSEGETVYNLGNGITVTATKQTGNGLIPGKAMIFDSAHPTGQDSDLGTPNIRYGGPGIGKDGGGPNKLFPNTMPRGNILIISEDENSDDPDDNAMGGELRFSFDPPRYLATVGLLDNDEGTVFNIVTCDGGGSIYINGNGGNNSFENVAIGKPSVKELLVTFGGSGGITDLQFKASSCMLENIADFSVLKPGESVTTLTTTSVTTSIQAYDAEGKPAKSMVFDSSSPTGGDFDLGTPHTSFDGPGKGNAGKKGKLFQNSDPKGNVLIISEDGDETDPDDDANGGFLVFQFSEPIYVESVGLLDNDDSTLFSVTSADGSESHTYNANGGNNSFELVKIGKPAVTQLVVTFAGSGAITEINTCAVF